MKLSELYNHNEAYYEICSVLKKYKSLPLVADLQKALSPVMYRIKLFDKWHIDFPNWNDCLIFEGISIRERDNDDALVLIFPPPRCIFGYNSTELIGNAFLTEFKNVCPPMSVNHISRELVYKKDDAVNAYETLVRLFRKYKAKQEELDKQQKIKNLKKQLAELVDSVE